MAHFAELDENNIVKRVLVVANHVITKDDKEYEELGVEFLKNIFGSSTIWKQTSYNRTFRVNHAGRGMAYDPENDMFYDPVQPYPSFSYNVETGWWEAPVERPFLPDDRPCKIEWNEDTKTFDIIDL